jgi:CHAD domain-containing protein
LHVPVNMGTAEHVFHENFHTLRSLVPDVREGRTEAIHDARVATRRLRSLFPILADGRASDADNELREVIRATSRSLGRARDVDVSLELLDEFESRAPAHASTIGAIRVHLQSEQLERRRQLIKQLESIDLDALALVANGSRRRGGLLIGRRRAAQGERAIVRAIADFAAELGDALDRATGVYFPRRAHAVRIAAKKLRYVVELLDAGMPARKSALKLLRNVQQVLGQIHDREVLAKRVKRLRRDESIPRSRAFVRLLEAESRSLFGKYLAQRDRLRSLDDDLLRWSRPIVASDQRFGSRVLTVGAVALPSAALLMLAPRALSAMSPRR